MQPNVPYHLKRRSGDHKTRKTPTYGWQDEDGKAIWAILPDGSPICGHTKSDKSKCEIRGKYCGLNGRCRYANGGGAGGKITTGRRSIKADEQRQIEIFIGEYLIDFSAHKAATRAGIHSDAAERISARWLKRADVQERLKARMEQRQEQCEITAEELIKAAANIVRFDFRKLHREDGSLKDLHEIDDETASAIAGLEVVELNQGRGEERQAIGLVRKWKTSDRLSAIQLLMKYKGMLTEKMDVTTKGESINLTDEQRADRIVAIIDAARARGDRQAS